MHEENCVTTTVVETGRGPGCLFQLLWFVLVGWWLGQAAVAIAYVCMVTIIGIPIGVIILNNLPMIIALRSAPQKVLVGAADGRAVVTGRGERQLPFLVRAAWFVLVGWWLTALWVETAYLLCAIIIGLPAGFWMFDRVPVVLTLRRD
jgi:uncharacterized membrane protein YccF (DUF307 family)